MKQKSPPGHVLIGGPQEHTDTKTVQNTKVDDDPLIGKLKMEHSIGNSGDNHTAEKDHNTSADAMATQCDTDSGNQQK